eukprot:CCRYP_013118-RA/>CCRYP_013118-RA protein AED:0.52 eAED:0.39 QI:0/-1/0/1/-1/1/1/0/142
MNYHYIPATVTADEHEFDLYQSSLLSQVSAAISSTANFFYLNRDTNYVGRLPGSSNIKRTCFNMEEYIGRLGNGNFRRRYRMEKEAFLLLLDIVRPHLPGTGENKRSGGVPNGFITHAACLSMALRYFMGRSIGHCQSTWSK